MAVARNAIRKPEDYVDEIKALTKRRYPDAELRVREIRPREFQIDVIGDFEDSYKVSKLTAGRRTDILVDYDVWIIVMPIRRSELAAMED